jgi:dienelactone hydrolase
MRQARRTFLQSSGLLPLAGLLPPVAAGATARPADLGNLLPAVEQLARQAPAEYSFTGRRFRDFASFRKAGLEKLGELLLYRPEPVPLDPEVVERAEQGGVVREKVLYSTAAGVRVPAYLLLPAKRAGRLPAVIDLHSHGGMFLFGKEKVVDLGDNHPAMAEYHRRNYDGRPTATELARRGYVVLVSDAFFFGERRLLLDADRKYGTDRGKYTVADVKHLNDRCRAKEATLAKSLAWAGVTWPGVVAWDDQRSVDYLISRPEVDRERVGCLGISMGGYRACLLGALDARVKAACVTGFMSALRPMLRGHIDTHSWVHFIPGLTRFLDLPDVASLHAPRPLLVQQCARDALFPPEGMRDAVERIGAAYAKAGAKAAFTGRTHDVPHQFTRAMQEEAFEWLDRQLKR